MKLNYQNFTSPHFNNNSCMFSNGALLPHFPIQFPPESQNPQRHGDNVNIYSCVYLFLCYRRGKSFHPKNRIHQQQQQQQRQRRHQKPPKTSTVSFCWKVTRATARPTTTSRGVSSLARPRRSLPPRVAPPPSPELPTGWGRVELDRQPNSAHRNRK